MKMKPEHFEYIKQQINLLNMDKIIQSIHNSPNVPKCFNKRLRWDCFSKAGLSSFAVSTLYEYLNDEHIDTALKQIVKHG